VLINFVDRTQRANHYTTPPLMYVQIYRVLSNGDELELKRMYETLNLYDDNCDVSSPQLIL